MEKRKNKTKSGMTQQELKNKLADKELKWEWLQERLDDILDIAAPLEGEEGAFDKWKKKRQEPEVKQVARERRRSLAAPGLAKGNAGPPTK